MKRILFLSLLLLIAGAFTFSVEAKKKKKQEFNYEIAPVGVGTQGSALIKVFCYAKKVDQAIELAKPNAVHGILFKGVAGGNGVSPQPALVSPAEYEKNIEFFDAFFENGTYERFVSLSSDGTIPAKDRLKVGKLYKIGIIVSVNKADLRKYLEDAGIIKKLGGGIF